MARIKGSGIHFNKEGEGVHIFCAKHQIKHATFPDLHSRDLTNEKATELLDNNKCPECLEHVEGSGANNKYFNDLSDSEIRMLLHGLEVARCQFQEGLKKPKTWYNTSSEETVRAYHKLYKKLSDE